VTEAGRTIDRMNGSGELANSLAVSGSRGKENDRYESLEAAARMWRRWMSSEAG
jgi:hypothetical protein